MVNPLLTTIPCMDQPPDPNEQEINDLYPSCAVTRAMTKKAKQNDGDIDLTDTFLGQSFKHEITKSLLSSLSDKQTDLSDKVLTIMGASTRFPEAIPLRNIKIKNIVKAFVNIFHIYRPSKVCSVGSELQFHFWNFSTGHT